MCKALTLPSKAQQSISCSQPQLISRVQSELAISSSKHPKHHSVRENLPRLPEPAALKLRASVNFAPAELRSVCAGAYNFAEGLTHTRLHCCLRNKPAGQRQSEGHAADDR
jgi:hypothetical protein